MGVFHYDRYVNRPPHAHEHGLPNSNMSMPATPVAAGGCRPMSPGSEVPVRRIARAYERYSSKRLCSFGARLPKIATKSSA